jgi:hypothetical protein
MTMTLDLLERTFSDVETLHTFAEAREKGLLFFKCANDIHADLQGDYWIQVARGWDLNFHKDYRGHYYMSTYRIDWTTGKQDLSPIATNLLDTKVLV